MKGTTLQEQDFVSESSLHSSSHDFICLSAGVGSRLHSFIQEACISGMTADLLSDHKSLQMCAFSQNRIFFKEPHWESFSSPIS